MLGCSNSNYIALIISSGMRGLQTGLTEFYRLTVY